MDSRSDIRKSALDGNIVVGILGMGYVGLPLACSFATRGTRTLGFDTNPERIRKLKDGDHVNGDVRGEDFATATRSETLTFTSDIRDLAVCDALIICVPTPLDHHRKPDMTYIESAAKLAGSVLKPGMLVSLESTTYPTTTEEFLLPILERESGWKAGIDFALCYSPERVDPGNKTFRTSNTPKVLGGLTPSCLETGKTIYSLAIDTIHTVSSPRVAELVKILENTYRLVNISLINELALLCTRMDIDIWEAIDAAKTKPFGFQAFYPGPGVGGHCIPLDPFYLQHVAKGFKFDLTMIEAAGQINTQMPNKMVVKIAYALNRHKKPLNGSKVLFLGVAYKPDIDDARESPALEMIDICKHKGCEVSYHDPHVANITTESGMRLGSVALDARTMAAADCVVVCTNHSAFDYETILEHSTLIVDLRNAIHSPSKKVFRLLPADCSSRPTLSTQTTWPISTTGRGPKT
ncbi:MAG: nucleotide sugar dehydrogenase [Fibrobacterota bacterium]